MLLCFFFSDCIVFILGYNMIFFGFFYLLRKLRFLRSFILIFYYFIFLEGKDIFKMWLLIFKIFDEFIRKK